jgi:Aspartyl protease
MKRAAICLVLFCAVCPALADDIDGVQPAALDQPRVNLVVRRQIAEQPLTGNSGDGETFNIEAFLDTGASSIDLSAHTSELLGIKREEIGKNEVRFQDVGVGGGSEFAVSEPIYFSIAPMTPTVNVDDKNAIAGTYNLTVGPFRSEIGPLGSGMDFLTQLAAGDLDIVGMPVIVGKIVVLDTRDVNSMTDKIRTYVYDANSPAASHTPIPKTSQHVKLSYTSFAPFTKITPASAQPPAIWANPIIGPNPLHPEGDRTPALEVTHHGKAVSGSWLLDTGAAVSMISRKQAAALGVAYVAGSEDSGHPKLTGTSTDRQFVMTVGGIGGSKKAAGFFLDKLSLPTFEGTPIVFDHAPVLVADITVKDSAGHSFTLDGVLGMNFLVASAMVDESHLLPDIDKLTPGAFRWIVIDQPRGWLGFERNP